MAHRIKAILSVVMVATLLGPSLAAPKQDNAIIGGTSGKSTIDLKAEASDRYFSSFGSSAYNRPAPVYGPPGYSSGWVGYNGYNQGLGGGGYNGIRGFADGYNSGLGGYSGYDGFAGSGGSGYYNSPGYSSIGLNKFGNGGYGGYGGNGGFSSYNGYNNPAYFGSNNLGYGYYKNGLDGGYSGGYYGGKGALGLSGITPSYITGFRGYS